MATVVKRPSGKWQATVRRDGRSRSQTFTLRKDAVKWARAAELQAERGDVVDERQLRIYTFGSVLCRYKDEVAKGKLAGGNEALMIASILRDRKLAETRLNRLTASKVAFWRDQCLQNMQPATVCRYLGIMQHALDIAVTDWQMPLAHNVIKDVRRPRVNNRRERRLRGNEQAVLIEACEQYSNPQMAPLVRLALATAMRRGELLAMHWRDVDLLRCVVHLPTSKNGHARTVPLSVEAIDVLKQLQSEVDTGIEAARDEGKLGGCAAAANIFSMKPNAVLLAWRRICKRAGIDDLNFHDLRHECISRLFERGLSLPQVAMVSGHRDVRMLMRYTHLQVDDIVAKLHEVL
ncbi:integrase [Primorskyibacter sp. S87]|uniref:integrase n=1 Tax=Primorskyibacter sp. S87 TaxID=3415126 RepID=UPI003C7DAA48